MRLGFCVSGEGRLCRLAISLASQLGIVPTFVLLDASASDELELFLQKQGVESKRLSTSSHRSIDDQLRLIICPENAEVWALTFDRIIPSDIVANPGIRLFNVHPALLPAYAGRDGLRRSIEGNCLLIGATIHIVDAGVDTGPVLCQAVVPKLATESVEEVNARLGPLLKVMFLQVIKWYAEKRVPITASDGRFALIRDGEYGLLPVIPKIEDFIAELDITPREGH
jgi:phosphoribosylglycinamide formyltransferase-1